MIYNYNDRAVARIEAKTIRESHPQGCILWKGAHTRGYPVFYYAGNVVRVVNWLWDYTRGKPPEEMEHCHKCNNRRCINLSHIYIGTRQQNLLDIPLRSHCGFGHEFTEENTRYVPRANGSLSRGCKICHREWSRYYKKQRKANR